MCEWLCVCTGARRAPVFLEWVEVGITTRGCSELCLLYLEKNFPFSMAAFQSDLRLAVFSLPS